MVKKKKPQKYLPSRHMAVCTHPTGFSESTVRFLVGSGVPVSFIFSCALIVGQPLVLPICPECYSEHSQ